MCNGRALDRVTKEKHRPNRQKLSKKCAKIVFFGPLRTIFGHFSGENKPININKFTGLFRKWVGVRLFMCFPFSPGKRETHKQNSQEILGKGRESPGTVRDNPGTIRWKFYLCVFLFIIGFFPALIFADIFSTFFGHSVGVPIFWAVQRFAHYKVTVSGEVQGTSGKVWQLLGSLWIAL